MRPGRKRINIDLPLPIYYELIRLKTKHNLTITRYVLRALLMLYQHEALYEQPVNKDATEQ
jgi:hypothetical protein